MIANITQAIGILLRRFPCIHAGVKETFTKYLLKSQGIKTKYSFNLIGSDAMCSGEFEPEETHQIIDLLKGCNTFVNIGANVGYYSCLARSLGAKVIAFEPLNRNFQILKHNLQINNYSDIELFQIELGAKVSLSKIYGGGTSASLLKGWANNSTDYHELISTNTLDNMIGCRENNGRMLILIDVEGFEYEVLLGSSLILNKEPAPIWFVEICINEHQANGMTINPNLVRTFEKFFNAGYIAEKAGSDSGMISISDVLKWSRGEDLPKTHNFIFKKNNP